VPRQGGRAEFVRVTNIDIKPFDFHQNNQKRIVPPGGDVIIPWHLAAALFGPPGLPNKAPTFDRQKQYEKVRGLYGFSNGLSPEEYWDDQKPKITVTDLETSEEIVMLIDDPEGIHSGNAPAMIAEQPDVQALMRQIASLQTQMQAVLNAQTGAQPAAPGATTSPTVTSDAPPQVEPPTDPNRNPAFDAVPATVDLEELGISIEAPIADASDDSPQAVSTGDDPGKATTTRRRPAPKS
jgi:hypothetical protein